MATTSCPLLLEGQALIDALGYVDTEYSDSKAQLAVQHLVRAEMTTFAPSPTYLDFLPDYEPAFADHPRLQSEYRRVKANVPLNAIDFNRYQVREPSGDDAAAWEAAVRRLETHVELQSDRVMNLELQQAYAPKMWKVRSAALEGSVQQLEKALSDVKEAAEAVNAKRQQEQALNAPKMQSYKHKFEQLIEKNASIKRACEALERKVAKKRKVEENPAEE